MKSKPPLLFKVHFEDRHVCIEREARFHKDRFISHYLVDPEFPALHQVNLLERDLNRLIYAPKLLVSNPMSIVLSYSATGMGQPWSPFINVPRGTQTINVIQQIDVEAQLVEYTAEWTNIDEDE